MPTVNRSTGANAIQSAVPGESLNKTADSAGVSKANSDLASRARGRSASVNVDLSPEAREVLEARNKALDIARNTPDVREDRVAALKAKIAAGDYKVDPEKVADGIVREALLERLANLPEE